MATSNYTAVTASAAITTGPTIFYGWEFAENAGTPAEARVLIRDGGAGGTILYDIRLLAKESAGDNFAHPISLPTSMYVEVNLGAVRGSLFWGALR